MPNQIDVSAENLAPDMDAVVIYVGNSDWQIDIGRDENGEVSIVITDMVEGNQTTMTLGQEGETQKV